MPRAKEVPVSQGFTLPYMVVGESATFDIDGAPPDTDIVVTVAYPAGGADEQTVHTDDAGHAEVTVTPSSVGTLSVVATQTVVNTLASASAEVSGSPPIVALSLGSVDPTSFEAGPPARFMLTAVGDGFDINTRMSFGVFSQEEADAGLGEVGAPKWEPSTRYVDAQHVAIDINPGQFPGVDPAIPVSVGQPDGTTAGSVNFAFTEPPPEEEPQPIEGA